MNLTHCPLCNTRVHSTHRCHARPVDLVPMPADFRSRVQATIPVDTKQLDLPALAAYLESGGRTIEEENALPLEVDSCCGHTHTPTGCTGAPTPSDVWAGVTVETCDCDER